MRPYARSARNMPGAWLVAARWRRVYHLMGGRALSWSLRGVESEITIDVVTARRSPVGAIATDPRSPVFEQVVLRQAATAGLTSPSASSPGFVRCRCRST